MTRSLKPIQGAYASMVVAAYQPIIARWYSGYRLLQLADLVARRHAPQLSKMMDLPTVWQFQTRPLVDPDLSRGPAAPGTSSAPGSPATAGAGSRYAATLRSLMPESERPRPVEVEGFPHATLVGNRVDLHGQGVSPVRPSDKPRPDAQATPTPILAFARRTLPSSLTPQQHREMRTRVFGTLTELFDNMLAMANWDQLEPGSQLQEALGAKLAIPGYWRGISKEYLSPIGVAHFFRQLYFNVEEGIGPIEEAFTIAPRETFEIVYETSRRLVHEEEVEVGNEMVSETATETKNVDEISDKVSTMVQNDTSASMSFSAGGGIGVWSVSGSGSTSMNTSSQRSREETSRRLHEMTRRASERITKSVTVRRKEVEEVSSRNVTRRVIQNTDDEPVSYALRRVFRRVRVKVQGLGPRLVWQLYIRDPGEGLALGKFVHFRPEEPISVPDVPPGLPPRPAGGVINGSAQSSWQRRDDAHDLEWFPLSIQAPPGQRITAVSVDSLRDLEEPDKSDISPGARNDKQWNASWNDQTRTYYVEIGLIVGNSVPLGVQYSYVWEPTGTVMDEWEALRKEKVKELEQQALNEQFERHKVLITERSKIRRRPANDLRREERFEIMNRMISHLAVHAGESGNATPLEIETFHKFLDIEAMFITMHPSWWRPRYTADRKTFHRDDYEVTRDSDPAPMGSSLGWVLQVDGDTRRNEFLNSAWARVCVPLRPHVEKEAIAWIAAHVEGSIGYDPTREPLLTLLRDIATAREREAALGIKGPEWIKVDSTPGAPPNPLSPEGVYPIVDDFQVTVPTDGFVYEQVEPDAS